MSALFPRLVALPLLLAALLPPPPAVASVDPALDTSLLVVEGDLVGADAVDEIRGVFVSADGHVLILADLTGSSLTDDVLLMDGPQVVHRAGDDAPGIASLEVLASFGGVDRNAQGELAWSCALYDQPGSAILSRRVLYLDDTPLLQTGDLASWPGANPGTTLLSFGPLRFAGDRLLVAITTDDPTLSGFSEQALVFLDPQTGVMELVAQSGDPAPGLAATFRSGTLSIYQPHTFDGNAAGQALFSVVVDFTAGGSASAVYRDDTLLALTGQPSPVPGRDWSTFGSDVPVSLTDDGVALFGGQLDGDPATATVLVRDDTVLAQAGVTTQVDIAPTTFVNLDGARQLGDRGDLLHYAGFWGGTIPSGQNQGLLLNGRFVLREGFSVIDGQAVVETYPTSQFGPSHQMTRDGSLIAARTEISGGLEAVVRIDRSTYDVLGEGLAGASGVAPLLRGDGSLLAGTPYSLTLSGAAPSTNSFLVLGASDLSAPFKGGLLIPFPHLVQGGFLTDAFGGWQIGGPWPAGVTPGQPFWVQVWIVDPSGPVGFTSSNGLTAITP